MSASFLHMLKTPLERKMYEAIREAGSRKEVDFAKACAAVCEEEIKAINAKIIKQELRNWLEERSRKQQSNETRPVSGTL